MTKSVVSITTVKPNLACSENVGVSRTKNLLLPSESSWAAAGHCVSDVPEDDCRCLIARHHLLTRQGHAHTYQGARSPHSLMSHVKSRHDKFSDEKDQSGISVSFFSSIKTLNYICQEDLMCDFNIPPFHSGVFVSHNKLHRSVDFGWK